MKVKWWIFIHTFQMKVKLKGVLGIYLLPLCFLRDPVGRHALGSPPKSRWSARSQV